MKIDSDDPTSPDVRPLLEEHLRDMWATSPPESVHALDPETLAGTDIEFFTAREDGAVIGCGALKHLDATHGEFKSMRTSAGARGRGVASALLEHLLGVARERGYERVSLETGAEDYFEPARRLYERYGFIPCEPFAAYTDDPNSVYLSRAL
ncbi:putative acetyltransferase [Leifsonia sp. AK011]|uniref:GNAT family N-acetyltransferase n=1 Tax=Leifsonia sp. AK011 TaxID=2723075 RepID=UPI0015CAE4C1|nr:GNAT family N-acetyltransferase [Leifsonia sp. AK011]NYF09305.1 putative acetyltransferase [Leifsonia sp. AK011]